MFVADPFVVVAVAVAGIVFVISAADDALAAAAAADAVAAGDIAAAADVAAAADIAAAAADLDWIVDDCSDAGELDLVEYATAAPTTEKSVVLLPGVQFGQRTCSACGERLAALKAISGVTHDSLLFCKPCR